MTSKLFAYLSYADAPAAIDFLQKGLGFEVVRRNDGKNGSVMHAELRRGDVVVMLSSNDAAYQVPPLVGRSSGYGLYLLVDDVDALYTQAIGAGAKSVFAPESTEWGTRRARIHDPHGYEWSFGTYEPGQSW